MGRLLIATGAVGLLLLTGGCGSGHEHAGGASPSVAAPKSGSTFNAADVTFVTGMIPHHRQALQMSEMAAAKATTPEVKALAERIAKAQDPEIATMSGWLTAWGVPVPAEHGHSADHAGMAGMMTEQQMQGLAAASGGAFDRMWLQMMVEHHQGAVKMAETVRTQGQDPAVRRLAEAVATSQSAEITEMQGLLAKA